VTKKLHALLKNKGGLLAVIIITEYAGGKCRRIFGETLGVKITHLSNELLRIAAGCRDRHGRTSGVNVNGRDVELQVWLGALEIKAADAGSFEIICQTRMTLR